MINGAINRTMSAYNSIHNRTSDSNGDAREKLTDYLAALLEFGELDETRLEQLGLAYLTDLDVALDVANDRADGPRHLH